MYPNTILQINKFHYIRGGAERYYFNLSRLLKQQGHKVIHFSMDDPRNFPSPFKDHFVSNLEISSPQMGLGGLKKAGRIIYSLESRNKMKELVKIYRPEIAHVHNIYHQISPSILSVLKKNNIPVVMSLHDYKLISPNYKFMCGARICEHKGHYYKEIFHRSIKNSYLASALCVAEIYIDKIFKLHQRNVDLFLAPSEFIKNKFVEYGFDERKIKVLPYTLETEEYSSFLPTGRGKKFILYLGRLSEEKGIEVLIDAMGELNNIYPNMAGDVTLKIVGEGPLEEKLKLKVQNLNLNNIEFIGFKLGKALKQVVAESLAVVVPSAWYENSPLAIYEAMALGKPVIGSRVGGIPELVQENITGLLFEVGNHQELAAKIHYLLNNNERLLSMGEAARDACHKFNFKEHYGKIMEVYREVLQN